MKTMQTLCHLLAILTLAGLASVAWAAEGDAPTTRPAPRVHGRIIKIDGAVISVEMHHRGAEPVTILTDANTKVKIDGEDKKVSDLREGMFVTVFGPDGEPAKAIRARTKIPGGGSGAPGDAGDVP